MLLDDTLESLKKRKCDNPEATAMKKIRSDVADLLQGAVIQFATKANCKQLLSDNEKDAANPHSQHNVTYTSHMLDKVMEQVKQDEEKFEPFVAIVRDMGGPCIDLTTKISKYLFIYWS